jgi:hypothetical protein
MKKPESQGFRLKFIEKKQEKEIDAERTSVLY